MGESNTAKLGKVAFGKTAPRVRLRDNGTEQMRLIANSNGTITYANDAFAHALGLNAADLVGRNVLDSVLFEKYDDIINDRAIFNSLSQGQGSSISTLQEGEHALMMGEAHDRVPFYFNWITAQDGQRYIVAHSIAETTNTPSAPNWREILGALLPSNQVDNTANKTPATKTVKTSESAQTTKKTPKKRSAAKKKLKSLTVSDIKKFSAFNSGLMCLMENDGTLIRTNDSLSSLLGKKPKSNFLQTLHPESRALARQYIQSLTSHDAEDGMHQHNVQFESEMAQADTKTSVWIQWSIHKDGDYLYALGHDITSAKNNENALLRREQELSEAQALANMGHWRWNVGSETIEWSDQIYKIFGVTRDEFVPTLDNTNGLLHKRDIGRMMQAFQRAIIEQNNYDLDFRVVRSDGSIRYVRCEGRCELDADGDAIALYGVMQDITEQTEHEMQLREAKESAEQAYAAKSRFLANMSHELRTPLNAIIGFSDMIQRQMLGPLGSEKYVDYATSIKDSGEHLLDLITDILDMSKIEAGKYDLDIEEIQLGQVINTAVRMIESRAQEGVLTLDNKIQSEGPIVSADRRAVMQILLNVLSNAVKFTEPGGTITITCEEFENHVSVKIADTGIGIPANKLNAVMRPFEQVSTAFTRNHEGSGLGLAITKELAELHGGLLNLESTVGSGTTATLRLPRHATRKK